MSSNNIVMERTKAAEAARARALAALVARHGVRVRAGVAMQLLCIADHETFRKVVDANPKLKHCLPGESQPKYLTAEIFALLPAAAWCGTVGQEKP